MTDKIVGPYFDAIPSSPRPLHLHQGLLIAPVNIGGYTFTATPIPRPRTRFAMRGVQQDARPVQRGCEYPPSMFGVSGGGQCR